MSTEETNDLVAEELSPRSLADVEIVTERKLSRRSFLTAAGALLAGGAFATLAESRADALAANPGDDAKKKHKKKWHKKKKHGKMGTKKTH